MKYFLKELVTGNPLNLSSGAKINWEMVANDTGVVALEEASSQPQIAEFRALILARRGGVMEIDQETYDKKKANPQFVTRTQSFTAQPFKLIARSADPLRSVQPVTVPESAKAAVEQSPVPAAEEKPTSPKRLAPNKRVATLTTKKASVPAPQPVAATAG